MTRIAIFLLGAAFWSILMAPASAAVTIASGYNSAHTSQGDPYFYDVEGAHYFALPQVGTLSAAAGDSSASTTFNLREDAGQTVFDWSFHHARDGSNISYGRSLGHLEFTVDSDTTYDVSGLYTLEGGPSAFQFVYLYDSTSGGYALYSSNYSNLSEDEILEVGAPTGDINKVFGSTSGILTAGHTYRFEYNYYVYAEAGADDGATATGDLNLTLDATLGSTRSATLVAANPEPASLVLWTLGGLGCVAGAYRRRRAAA